MPRALPALYNIFSIHLLCILEDDYKIYTNELIVPIVNLEEKNSNVLYKEPVLKDEKKNNITSVNNNSSPMLFFNLSS